MKKCPNCSKNTVPLKWLLLNKSEDSNKLCYTCPNCHTKIKKQKFFLLEIFTAGALMEGTLVLMMTIWIGSFLTSILYSLLASILFFTILRFSIEYFSVLNIADESYYRGEWTRLDAFFILIFMTVMIGIVLYCLVIQPFLLTQPPCS